MTETVNEGLIRMARERMEQDSETAGFPKSTAAPLVSIPITDSEALSADEAKNLVSMTFMSRTTHTRPHVVSVGFDGMVWCICQSTTPCWGIKAFCRLTGRPVYQ